MGKKKRKKIPGDACRVVVTWDMNGQLMHDVFYAKGRAHVTTEPDGRGAIHFVNGRTESGRKVNYVTYRKISKIGRYPE